MREVGAVVDSFVSICNLEIINIRTGAFHTVVRGIHNYTGCPRLGQFLHRHIGYFTMLPQFVMGGGERPTVNSTVVIIDIASDRVVKRALDIEALNMPYPRWNVSGSNAYVVDRYGLWEYRSNRFVLTVKRPSDFELLDLVPRPTGRVGSMDDDASLDVIVKNLKTESEGIGRLSLISGALSSISVHNIHLALTTERENAAVTLPEGSFIMEAESATSPQELWTTDASDILHQIGETNPQLTHYTFGKSKLLQWRSARGDLLRGGLLLPMSYHSGHRYPLVVFVYGFSHGSDYVNQFGLAWFNMQLLASRGYAVLFPDQPIREGHQREDLVGDIVPGVREAAHHGYIDERRVAIMGQSSGGYGVAAIITQTAFFKAAIMANGPTDLISYYLSMDDDGNAFGIAWLERLNGAIGMPLWTGLDRYIENTPILHLDRVQTPLLILDGVADKIVPSQQMDEMFVGLRRLNKEVTYVRYPGEGHVVLDYTPTDQTDWWNRIFNWLSRHLR
jgi:acetyl esterase/lipase